MITKLIGIKNNNIYDKNINKHTSELATAHHFKPWLYDKYNNLMT